MFITPVSMPCTKEQYKEYLKEPLEKMGYQTTEMWENCDEKYICTNFSQNDLMITTYKKHLYFCRYCIESFNPDLFLALAAMADDPEGIQGEYWKYIGDNNLYFTKNKIYKQIDDLSKSKSFIDNKGLEDGFCGGYNIKNFTKSTKEEIINHFKPTKMKEILKSQMKQIHDVACSVWKEKINNWVKEQSEPLSETVTITEEQVKEMLNASNDEQKKVIKSVFKIEDEKFVTKPGDVCVNDKGSVFIFKKMCKNGAEPYIGFCSDKTFTDGEFYSFGIRLANKEERIKFFERLTKEGYKWDSKKLKLTKKWVPKNGDFVVDNDGVVCIYHSTNESGGIISFVGIGDHLTTMTDCGWGYTKNFKPANENQKQTLLDAMHSAGKDWDAVNKKVVDYKWKPKMGESYFIPNPISRNYYTEYTWGGGKSDGFLLERELVVRTKEEAIDRAKQMLNTK